MPQHDHGLILNRTSQTRQTTSKLSHKNWLAMIARSSRLSKMARARQGSDYCESYPSSSTSVDSSLVTFCIPRCGFSPKSPGSGELRCGGGAPRSARAPLARQSRAGATRAMSNFVNYPGRASRRGRSYPSEGGPLRPPAAPRSSTLVLCGEITSLSWQPCTIGLSVRTTMHSSHSSHSTIELAPYDGWL
jgi:hypothetical protein